MDNLIIEKAVPENAQDVFQIFQSARGQMTYLPHLHTEEDTRKFIYGLVDNGTVYVAKNEKDVLGFIEVSNNFINHLYISPNYQGHGVGKKLLDFAKGKNPDGLSLWVFEENDGAIKFYEREGFKLMEKREINPDNEEHLPDRKYFWKKD